MRLFTGLVICSLMACGGGDGVSPDQLAERLAQVQCGKLADCCTPEEFKDETFTDTEEECRAFITAFGTFLEKGIQDSIAAGRLVYHGDRAADCFDELERASCIDYQVDDGFERCADPFEGKVAAGGACANDFDCISDLCVGEETDLQGNITLGTCHDAPAIGAACIEGECGEGAFCATGTCQAPRADGAACTRDDQCASGGCNASVCGAPTTCDGV